jgi:hypothetical protein
MTRSKRIPINLLLVLVLALVAVAAACGSDSSDDGETVSTDDTPADSGADPIEPPLGAGPYPIAEIAIDYTDDATSYSYGITCLGDTATVLGEAPKTVVDQRACLALADEAVQRRLIDGPPGDQICSAQYGGPDMVTITGRIDDQPVDTTVDLTNGCGISDWNELLADLLPRPTGA